VPKYRQAQLEVDDVDRLERDVEAEAAVRQRTPREEQRRRHAERPASYSPRVAS
jgi:hypothetical protein